jgi:peptidoglycan hydrolase-like protein with peptidoglycan-binding domain
LEFESLEPGSRGEEVLALQRYLKETGYLRGTVDGDYGRGTQAAVSEFQKANGLEATGHADKETIQTINRLAAEAAREAEQQNKE